jgi:hypothetical protein
MWGVSAILYIYLALGSGPVLAQSASADEWPFVRTSCPEAAGEPLPLVAMGTSETAGWGIRSDQSYSPQEAYPARYADLLCAGLGRPVVLHSYFPDQRSNTLAPLAWWNERLSTDEALRADLTTADVVVLWPFSVHDVVPALLFGRCQGPWPEPLKGCFEAASADVQSQMDTAFSTIAELVPDTAVVLATDAYAPPAVLDAWGAEPYFGEIKQLVDPHYVVERLAPRYGFTMVGTEAAFNGPSLSEPPADGLFQADGIHPTALGAQLAAEVLSRDDGLDD